MDILSHALWAGAAGELIRRRRHTSGRMLAATVALGAAPDIVSLLPMAVWSLSQPASFALTRDYISAMPGTEPAMPAIVGLLSHHAHCAMHSAVVAAAVGLLIWWRRPRLLPVLVGWWLHIALDIPTHSNDYYAVPFLYPLAYWGINGVAWTTPWVLATDYVALGLAFLGLFLSRGKHRSPH